MTVYVSLSSFKIQNKIQTIYSKMCSNFSAAKDEGVMYGVKI